LFFFGFNPKGDHFALPFFFTAFFGRPDNFFGLGVSSGNSQYGPRSSAWPTRRDFGLRLGFPALSGSSVIESAPQPWRRKELLAVRQQPP